MTKKNNDITLGIILIFIGGLFLLNTLDIIRYNIWNLLFRYWPVFLIIIGINILFKSTKLWWLSPLLIIVLLVLLFVPGDYMPSYIQNFRQDSGTHMRPSTEPFESEHEYLDNHHYFDVYLSIDSGRIDIGSLANDNYLYKLLYNYHNEKPNLDFDFDLETNRAQLNISHMQSFEFDQVDVVNNSKLNLNKEAIHNINIESGIGRYNLELKDLDIEELIINTGISEIYVSYNDFPNETIINSGASNIEFEFPDNIGIQIETRNITNKQDFIEKGFIEIEENIFQNEKYDEAENRIMISLSSPATNIEVSFRDN
ncbi:hypothetical protein I0Q91_09150 [Halanaerobiaceae bacterium Z-7014]|uniref:LiaI-LiaF-like transmembrane region domain-containing protein n=1 Tax=Halonatronomonas betaini TaxID=2778430 RepID=A0A931AYP8_9FIRM|nr:hypothetical protein [Halonatronomonas betaini]